VGADFVPGSYWTPERARAAVAAMTREYESPAMQALLEQIATTMEQGADPAAAAAAMSATPSAGNRPTSSPIGPDALVYRRAIPADVPALASLVVHGELPPFFIEPFARGFVAVEHAGELVACGGLEVYDRCGVLRSVVVHERARGQRIGERIAHLLTEEARAAAITDLYLFTMHAHDFWQKLGYVDVPLDAWKQPPRACWQYRFMERYPTALRDVFVMWRAA